MTQNDVIIENFNSMSLLLEDMKNVPAELMADLIKLIRESSDYIQVLSDQIYRSYQEGLMKGYELGHLDGWDEAVKYLNAEYKNIMQKNKLLTIDISEDMERLSKIYYNEQFASTLKSRTNISEITKG